LRQKKCEISQLAAITFTVKAAAQLRERLQAELERDPAGVEHALRNLDRAFIGTTHAFCARLLRERPIEAGLDPDFQEVDQVQAALQAVTDRAYALAKGAS
jgi:ATP-dependent helicase/nuclease subunit A